MEEVQGFAVAHVSNASIALSIVPELGAKLLSLRNLVTGREWLWRPGPVDRLFRNERGDAFTSSTLIGADECLPTIAACHVEGWELEDHGEVWSVPWTLDASALADGIVRTTVRLVGAPWVFSRSVRLEGSAVILDYSLTNDAPTSMPFLWSFHPLLTYVPGDRLSLPGEVRDVRIETAREPHARKGEQWSWPVPQPGVDLAALTLGGEDAYAKFFAGPLSEGYAGINNPLTGDRLDFRWPAASNPFVGVWLTRGGWRGAHHPAIEPTNTPHDSLADALLEPTSRLYIDPGSTRQWRVCMHIGPTSA